VSPATPWELSRSGPAGVFFIGIEPALEEAQARLADAVASLPLDVDVHTRTPVGDAGEQLVAATADLDLLVMGLSGARLARAAAGRQRVVGGRRRGTLPLIIVPAGVRTPVPRPPS
jgi:hypothetical protein